MGWMGKMHAFSSCKRFFLQKSFEIVGTHIVKASGITYICPDNSSFIDWSIALKHPSKFRYHKHFTCSSSGWIIVPQRLKAMPNISVLQRRLISQEKTYSDQQERNAFFNCISSKCLAKDDWKCFMKSLSCVLFKVIVN